MVSKEKQAWAIAALCQKAKEMERLPKKEDFSETDRSRIKAFLGPWPRALEAAGLKPLPPKRSKSKKGGRI